MAVVVAWAKTNLMLKVSEWLLGFWLIPSGKLPHNSGKSPFLMGKVTTSMAIFNSYVKGNYLDVQESYVVTEWMPGKKLQLYRIPENIA